MDTGIEEEIRKIQVEYIQSLEQKLSEFKALLPQYNNPENSKKIIHLAHKTAGSGGTYGLQSVSLSTRFIEDSLLTNRFENQTELFEKFTKVWIDYFKTLSKAFNQCANINHNSLDNWNESIKKIDSSLLAQWQKIENDVTSKLQKRAA